MNQPVSYASDLAYVHDSGFGDFARQSAPGLLARLAECQIVSGRVVDLGCGSGIWARQLVDRGYEVVGVDISAAMIEMAQQRVPEGQFQIASLFDFRLPDCGAITALGEVFNYLFDARNSLAALRRVCQDAFAALLPGGLLIFDVAEPGRCRDRRQSFSEAADWVCLVEYQHDPAGQRLTRRIVTFRQVAGTYRRQEETHCQQLYQSAAVAEMLAEVGFETQVVRAYGGFALAEHAAGFIARKPPLR